MISFNQNIFQLNVFLMDYEKNELSFDTKISKKEKNGQAPLIKFNYWILNEVLLKEQILKYLCY